MQTLGPTSNRPLSTAGLIVQVFLYPDEGLQRVARQQPVGWAIALIASVTFVYALVSWTDRTAYDVGYPLMYFMDKPWKAGLTSTAIALVLILISSAALHWISWLFGGQGSYPETLSALGFAGVPPGIVGIILTVLAKDMGELGEALKITGDIGLFFWGLVLGVIAVREAHGLSTLHAVGVYAVFTGIVVVLVLLWAFVPLLALVGALLTAITLVLWPSALGRRR